MGNDAPPASPSAGGGLAGGSGHSFVCDACGACDTPQWRSGPNGPNTLCNACGVKWKRSTLRAPIELRAADGSSKGDEGSFGAAGVAAINVGLPLGPPTPRGTASAKANGKSSPRSPRQSPNGDDGKKGGGGRKRAGSQGGRGQRAKASRPSALPAAARSSQLKPTAASPSLSGSQGPLPSSAAGSGGRMAYPMPQMQVNAMSGMAQGMQHLSSTMFAGGSGAAIPQQAVFFFGDPSRSAMSSGTSSDIPPGIIPYVTHVPTFFFPDASGAPLTASASASVGMAPVAAQGLPQAVVNTQGAAPLSMKQKVEDGGNISQSSGAEDGGAAEIEEKEPLSPSGGSGSGTEGKLSKIRQSLAWLSAPYRASMRALTTHMRNLPSGRADAACSMIDRLAVDLMSVIDDGRQSGMGQTSMMSGDGVMKYERPGAMQARFEPRTGILVSVGDAKFEGRSDTVLSECTCALNALFGAPELAVSATVVERFRNAVAHTAPQDLLSSAFGAEMLTLCAVARARGVYLVRVTVDDAAERIRSSKYARFIELAEASGRFIMMRNRSCVACFAPANGKGSWSCLYPRRRKLRSESLARLIRLSSPWTSSSSDDSNVLSNGSQDDPRAQRDERAADRAPNGGGAGGARRDGVPTLPSAGVSRSDAVRSHLDSSTGGKDEGVSTPLPPGEATATLTRTTSSDVPNLSDARGSSARARSGSSVKDNSVGVQDARGSAKEGSGSAKDASGSGKDCPPRRKEGDASNGSANGVEKKCSDSNGNRSSEQLSFTRDGSGACASRGSDDTNGDVDVLEARNGDMHPDGDEGDGGYRGASGPPWKDRASKRRRKRIRRRDILMLIPVFPPISPDAKIQNDDEVFSQALLADRFMRFGGLGIPLEVLCDVLSGEINLSSALLREEDSGSSTPAGAD